MGPARDRPLNTEAFDDARDVSSRLRDARPHLPGEERRALPSYEIARDNDLPAKFLADILGDLRRAGLIHAKRGGQGGFWLARPAHAITVADVVRVLAGGPEAFLHTTPIESLWATLDEAVIGAAERITVQDLCGRALASGEAAAQ